jgi:hypothetical protein
MLTIVNNQANNTDGNHGYDNATKGKTAQKTLPHLDVIGISTHKNTSVPTDSSLIPSPSTVAF